MEAYVNRSVAVALAALACASVVSEPSNAQQRVVIDVTDCVEITSPEQRLACYERQVATVEQTPVAPLTKAESRAPTDDRDEHQAGSNEPRRFSGARSVNEAESDEIFAKIVELRETVPNSYVITLDNGQVWRQMRPKLYPMQPGYEVRIYASSWGSSYRLSALELKSFIQVERIR